MRRTARACGLLLLALLLPLAPAWGHDSGSPQAEEDLKKLSLEQLLDLEVRLAGRRPQPVRETPAAITVITRDDLRRAGVTTLAEALRLADGVFVGRRNRESWAISARGFAGPTPNKLLVMIDGRSIYTPLFGGVFWGSHLRMLSEIDRIEVIRGPGGTMWGANAVNGVINVITRHARESVGTFVLARGGNEEQGGLAVRHGVAFGPRTWMRVFGRFSRLDGLVTTDGRDARDDLSRGLVGFRLDSDLSNRDTVVVTGDGAYGRMNRLDQPHLDFSDGNVMARWTRTQSEASVWTLQGYFDRTVRRVPQQLTEWRRTFDLDLQHQSRFARRHTLVWGVAQRWSFDRTRPSLSLRFDPAQRDYPLFSAFVQDEVALNDDRVAITGGAKIEHNAFTGFELQPSVRARFRLPNRHVVWGAVSRAVRMPSRLDTDLRITTNDVVVITGAANFQSEQVVATEAGYRASLASAISVDLVGFYNAYDRLRSVEQRPDRPIPLVQGNTLNARTSGFELGVNAQPTASWQNHLSYTLFRGSFTRDPGSFDTTRGTAEGNDPRHQFWVRSALDLPRSVQFDATLRAVSALAAPRVPAYAELNMRLGWSPSPRMTLALVGHDLLHDRHAEYFPASGVGELVERSVFGELVWHIGPR